MKTLIILALFLHKTFAQICEDTPEWENILDQNCTWYAQQGSYQGDVFSYCYAYGLRANEVGITALEACCICGGGSDKPVVVANTGDNCPLGQFKYGADLCNDCPAGRYSDLAVSPLSGADCKACPDQTAEGIVASAVGLSNECQCPGKTCPKEDTTDGWVILSISIACVLIFIAAIFIMRKNILAFFGFGASTSSAAASFESEEVAPLKKTRLGLP